MKENKPLSAITALLAALIVLSAASAPIMAQEASSDFSADRWDLRNAKIVEHLGRKALMGTAMLKDINFENGVIEVDVAVSGARSYPGILFRVQNLENYERFYIRPHRAGCTPLPLYPDVLQYVPAFNGIDSWQLYNGAGFTAPAVIPSGQWLHVKLEVSGTQARVFVGNMDRPAMLIHELKHGKSGGTIGLMGPLDGTAYFSNFKFHADNSLLFDPSPHKETAPGIIPDWQISRPFRALAVDLEKTPEQQGLANLSWKSVTADDSGLVDISRYYARGSEPDCIFAKAILHAEADRNFKLKLGYSDLVSVFINGRLLFSGNSVYQSRDPSFLGVIGFFDTVCLPLQKGQNELILAVAESFGGWGFMAQDGDALSKASGLVEEWQTPKEFRIPESAAYDPVSRAVYVSNYDGYNRSFAEGKQFISKVTSDGRIEQIQWVGSLKNPTGLTVFNNKLYVVERTAVAEIDIAAAKIVQRLPIEGAVMLNDIAISPDGVIYVSDSAKGVIFRLISGQCEEWLKGPEVSRPNGVWVEKGKLVWGNNGDGCLKSADVATKEVKVMARLGQGIIDGIVSDGKGNILISHNEGRLYRISPEGEITKLLDTTAVGYPIADFTFVPDKKLLIIPTFVDNRVKAWRLE